MKKLFFVLFFLSSSFAFAEDPAPQVREKVLWEKLADQKLHYSALNEFFKETYGQEITKDDLAHLEELLYYTGIEILEDYDPSLLSRFPTSSTRFILGRQQLKAKNTKKALEYFSLIHQDHRFYPRIKITRSSGLRS